MIAMFRLNVLLVCSVLVVHTGVQGWKISGLEDSAKFISNGIDHGYGWKNSKNRVLSTPEECARTCKDGEKPRNCYYHFTLEYYTTMGGACNLCKPNNRNQISNVPQCQCIEADGFERGMLSINRMLPGPSIQVCKNDKVIIDVKNNVEGMEAALHWHGIWQRGSQYYDGVPFLTQCPILAGATFRYQFVASNPGTHFYHSHTGLQKIDGQYGSLIVREPRSADPHMKLYDQDLPTHVIVLSDWMHEMAIERFPGRMRRDPGQIPPNVLINGKGRWKDPVTKKTTSVQLETFVVQPGKRYRFRMITSFSTVCPAQITIEKHSLLLIAQDGESVSPVSVNTIISSSGERVDFILNANQSIGTYWIQVRAIGPCSEGRTVQQLAILKYAGGPATPKTPKPDYNENGSNPGIVYNDPRGECDQMQPNSICVNQLKSVHPVPKELFKVKPDHQIILPFKFFEYNSNSTKGLFKPGSYSRFLVTPEGNPITSLVDDISFAFPRVPPLSQNVNSSDTCNRQSLSKNSKAQPYHCPHTHHIKKGAIVEVVLYNQMSQTVLAHPFHLHGYTFYPFRIGMFPDRRGNLKSQITTVLKSHKKMLASGKYKKLAGKDTLAVPDGGYVIFRFKADNPGWWLFHCHFLYHTAIGMNVVFHVGEKKDVPPVPPMFPACSSYVPKIV